MPFFVDGALRSQVTDNSADFAGGKSRIHCDREIVKPELRFKISGPNVNVRRLKKARYGPQRRTVGMC
jgi:hypothetical protein